MLAEIYSIYLVISYLKFAGNQRNSHWRVQSFNGNPQAVKNDSGLGSPFSGRFDENNVAIIPPNPNPPHPVEADLSRNTSCKPMDQHPELANKGMLMPMPLQGSMAIPVQGDGVFPQTLRRSVSDAQATECPITGDVLNNQQEDFTIEGGTISISSVYSQG